MNHCAHVCHSLRPFAQVGYVLNVIGEFGNPANLHTDAKALASKLQGLVSKYGGAEYKGLQQAGMRADVSWDLPAQEWEQMIASD